MRKLLGILSITTTVLLLLFSCNYVYAQSTTTGHAVAISTNQSDIPSGSIISNIDATYQISTEPYDPMIFGVTSNNPSTYIDDGTAENKQLVVTQGEVLLRVNNSGGAISEGDYLTSSETPGVAQKATRTGQVVAIALDAFDANEGTILAFVEVGTQFIANDTQTNLFSTISEAFNSPFVTPLVSLRYLLAAIILMSSFIIAFLNFRRISGSSIEALGRNPLAKDTIRSTVILNFVITFAILLTGVVLTVVILIL